MRSKRLGFIVLCLSLLLPSWAAPAGAQSGAVGTIRGQVVAENGEPVTGAQVAATHRETGLSRAAVSDSAGRFELTGLPAGPYSLRAQGVGYTATPQSVRVRAGETTTAALQLQLQAVTMKGIEVFASRARERETPVAFSTMPKARIQEQLGSREVPMVLNTTPGVYATQQGGGAGDARINVRGFSQRNVAVMINGVPVNDMENGWVYWSNWDGLGDATSSIQLQRGIGASLLAVPSVGGTMNILTDAAALEKGMHFKQEVGSGDFLKSTLSLNSGLINDKLAFSFVGVRKTGSGVPAQTWTDAWGYFGALSYQVNDDHRLQAFVVGAPQQHGQRRYQMNVANWDADYARKLGIDLNDPKSYSRFYPRASFGKNYNMNWGRIDAPDAALREYYRGRERDVREAGVLGERINYYHKPQANLNWYWDASDRFSLTNVFYVSMGRGGGSGSRGRISYQQDGQIDWNKVFQANSSTIDAKYSPTEKKASTILRNSVNEHDWYGWVGTAKYSVLDNLTLTTGLDTRYYRGAHSNEVRNLIGGDYYLDFADRNQASPVKRRGDKISYHNDGIVRWYGGFGQLEGFFGKLTATTSFSVSQTDYKRVDYFLPQVGGKPAETAWESFPGYKVAGGANYNLTDAINVFANVGHISKAPAFNGVFRFDNTVYSGIRNETVDSYELGVGYRAATFAANLNLYNTDWNNRSVTRRIRDKEVDFYALLQGMDARHQGVELDLRYRPLRQVEFNGVVSLGNWKWLSDVESTVSPEDEPSKVRTINVYANGLKVGDAAQTQYALSTTLRPAKGIFVDVAARHFRDYFADFDPMDRRSASDRAQPWKVPAYTVADLSAGYTLPYRFPRGGTADLTLNVFNLFDTIYISDARDGSGHDAASAQVYLGLPRTVNLGMKLNF